MSNAYRTKNSTGLINKNKKINFSLMATLIMDTRVIL